MNCEGSWCLAPVSQMDGWVFPAIRGRQKGDPGKITTAKVGAKHVGDVEAEATVRQLACNSGRYF